MKKTTYTGWSSSFLPFVLFYKRKYIPNCSNLIFYYKIVHNKKKCYYFISRKDGDIVMKTRTIKTAI
jgi:hypothetical protein